jgi:hypothetical protein
MIQTCVRTADRDSRAGRQTRETYLDLAGNALASTERLRLHRTSLYCRVRHMAELADIGLKDGGEVSGSTWDSSWPGSAAVTVQPPPQPRHPQRSHGLSPEGRLDITAPGDRWCPHQTAVEVATLVCELRRSHPRWGPARFAHELERRGVEPVPSQATPTQGSRTRPPRMSGGTPSSPG